MLKIYMHIGAHKTGSTYIQKVCAEHESELSEQGVLYPKTGRKFFGHHHLVDIVKGNITVEETRALMSDELQHGGHKSIIVSSENFEWLQENEIERLMSLFGSCEFNVLYFFRNWNSMLHSMWQEDVKHGSTYSFHMYVAQHVGFPFASNVLNFSIPLRRYAKVMGIQKLIVSSYDVINGSTDLCDHFFSMTGVQPTIQHSRGLVNASLDPPIVETIRALNSVAISRGYKPSYLVRQHFLSSVWAQAQSQIKSLLDIMNNYVLPSPDYGQCFAARSFFKEFFLEFGPSLCHDVEACRSAVARPSETLHVIDPNYLLQPEAREIIHECWEAVEKMLIRETN